MPPTPSPTAGRRKALAALTAALVCAAVAAASAPAATLSPPVIHERFTLLPCPGAKHARTTLELEGCAEHTIVATDAAIDRHARAVFALLHDDAARRRFLRAQAAWLAYRQADCASMSDQYQGGTLAGLVDADCTAQRSARHLTDVAAFERLLRG